MHYFWIVDITHSALIVLYLRIHEDRNLAEIFQATQKTLIKIVRYC